MGPRVDAPGAVLARATGRQRGRPFAQVEVAGVALGDEVAARVVHETIGRLLGLPVAPEG
ncbi:hypothetical protein WMF27_05220 [Sorangium sp. So ce281]|uniref:hypothetical protein n=1 Tax=unclassified Sorangium TaxID=2621164 RepID=UPI003F623360